MSAQPATEESKKDYRTILEEQIGEGLKQLDRRSSGLLISGLSAGLDLGFGPFLMAVMLTLLGGSFPEATTRILLANMYALGFIFVIMGRSELFTEHTTLAVLPVLGRRASVRSLARLWGLVFAANLVGGALFAWLAVVIGPALGVAEQSAFSEIAASLVDHSWWVVLLSAVLAGWLMGLLSWLVAAGRDTVSQVLFVWLVAGSIGLAGLHHSIAGTVEVLLGVFAGQGATLVDFGSFLVWTTLGNALGGVFFVAVIKYGHAVRGGGQRQEVSADDLGPAKVRAGSPAP
ncbi:MAG: formate/nitrite transporter family protein [Actinomycetota bacterium]|nr:formate/nitrite transporter family protein [Actinomycetota bacterium]